MLFDLSDDHRLIQETVRDFARNEIAPIVTVVESGCRALALMLMVMTATVCYGGAAEPELPRQSERHTHERGVEDRERRAECKSASAERVRGRHEPKPRTLFAT